MCRCFGCYVNDPAANPYPFELVYAAVLLAGAFLLWRIKKPRAHPLLRVLAAMGSGFAALIGFAVLLVPVGVDLGTVAIMQLGSCLIVAASLLLEVALSPQPPPTIASAVARTRSGASGRQRRCLTVLLRVRK